MLKFPRLVPPTVDHTSYWQILDCDEALLAQQEAELEEKFNEIKIPCEGVVVIGKIPPENDQEEYEPDAEDEEADNVDEESDAGEFEQETG